MLNQIDLSKKTPKGTYAKQFDKKSAELGYLGRALRDAKVPVIILFEGFRGTYRGKLINKVISALDPRGFRVYSASKTTERQKMSPFFTQFWKELPPMGGISIHHRAWYFLRNEHDVGDPDEAAEWYNVPFHEINDFERTLYLGGYRIIKLFTHISQKQQEKNIAKDKDSLGSRWEALTPAGIEGVDYKAYRNVYEKMLTETNTVYAPWHVIPMEDVRTGILETMDVLISEFKAALSAAETQKESSQAPLSYASDPSIPSILARYDCNKDMDEKTYDEKLKKYQKRLAELQVELAKRKISTVVALKAGMQAAKAGPSDA